MSDFRHSAQGYGFAVHFPDDIPRDTSVRAFSARKEPQRKMSRTALGSGFAAALLCFGLLSQQFSSVMAFDDSGQLKFFTDQARTSAPSVFQPQSLPPAGAQPSRRFFSQPSRQVASQPSRQVAAQPSPRRPNFALVHNDWRAETPNLGTAVFRKKRHEEPALRSMHPAVAIALTGSRWRGAVASEPSLGSGSLSRRSVCVRLCDGFFFPIGDLPNDGDISGHEALCTGLCPGAPARLYVVPSGSDRIEDAVGVQSRKPYTALPVAFRHAAKSDRTCSCHPQVEASSISLLKDFTLRRGDGVMTHAGIKIFHGAQHWPYKRNDFLSLAATGDLSNNERGALAAIEWAARGVKPVVKAKGKAAVPAADNSTPSAKLPDADGKSVRVVGPQAVLTQ